ncbi:hypothetical protein ACFL3M_02280 [Patescibacteria group bacterium]
MNIGKVSQVIGPVVDVEFEEKLPKIYDALEIKLEDDKRLVLETHQHLGGNKVRAVAMGATDGLRRGLEVVDTEAPIKVPVGEITLGRMFNLLGDTIDGKGEISAEQNDPIHRGAPVTSFASQTIPHALSMSRNPLSLIAFMQQATDFRHNCSGLSL